ncbi:hypothetical protein [Thalassotalea profundi]|uniref:Uncharacterized protein n=1 Tax=Thalassotalea profundi TaxID=2036687 RepID=A0ABQ3IVV9_9GAMM|nr:hypothetical protein [Thalassotalea profundi]GHE95851.1 hypothetical protein GCM10011501_26790 [Thalassotalea profundi]
MLNFIIFLVIIINVSSIYYYRNYSNEDEKTAFFSGVFTLSLLPVVVKGLFLSATNIQNIYGDLSGYSWIYFIVFFTTLYSAIYVSKVLVAKISNKFFNKSN